MSKTIKFKVEILSNEPEVAENISTGTFGFKLPGSNIEEIADVTSNKVIIYISNASLTIDKTSDLDFAMIHDIITYTIVIRNNGDVKAENIIFKDKLAKGTKFIPRTLTVNGKKTNSVNIEVGINVGSLEVGESLEIKYQVEVIATTCNRRIENIASAKFSYVLVNNKSGSKEFSDTTDTNLIEAAMSIFKQLSVEEELEIPMFKPDIESINEVTGTVDIVGCHLIETATLISQENQRLTGFKLVVTGMLNIVIKYTALDVEQSVHSAHYRVPFSTFIVMPEEYTVGSKIDVEGIVEHIYFKAHDERDFFTNTTLMLNGKILDC